jgi:hypothetical protein
LDDDFDDFLDDGRSDLATMSYLNVA